MDDAQCEIIVFFLFEILVECFIFAKEKTDLVKSSNKW